jgi:hypothetical protein
MAQIDRSVLESSLLNKGFRRGEADHRVFYSYHEGKRTSIRTKTSRSSNQKSIGGDLLGVIKRQMKLDTSLQLLSFANCDLTEEEYTFILKEKNLLD